MPVLRIVTGNPKAKEEVEDAEHPNNLDTPLCACQSTEQYSTYHPEQSSRGPLRDCPIMEVVEHLEETSEICNLRLYPGTNLIDDRIEPFILMLRDQLAEFESDLATITRALVRLAQLCDVSRPVFVFENEENDVG